VNLNVPIDESKLYHLI